MSRTTQNLTPEEQPDHRIGFETLSAGSEFQDPIELLDENKSTDHLALIYDTEEEQFATVVPFIRQGLEQGEQCLYIAAENSREDVLAALRAGGINVESALESGALSVHTAHEAYLKDGVFDSDEGLAFLEEAVEEASVKFEGLRVASETMRQLNSDGEVEEFMALEACANDLLHDEDCLALCQYNRERFPPAVIEDVIRTHPYLIYDDTVCQNCYYQPPEEYFGPEQREREIDRKLQTLTSRTRAQARLKERTGYLHAGYEIIADSDRSFEEKLQALFELGRDRFGLEWGAMAEVDLEADRFEVEYISDETVHFEPGVELPLSETYCAATADIKTAASVTDPTEEGYDDITVYEEYGIKTYLGTFIEVEDGPNRTLFFVSSESREESFSEADHTFQKLLGRWIQYELERRQREQELKRQREYTDDLLDTLDDAFFVLDDDGTVQKSNEAASEMIGCPDTKPESIRAIDFTEEDANAVWESIQEAFETGETRVEAKVKTATGESVPWEFSASVLEDPNENQVVAGTGRNLTERKAREHDLELFRNLIDHSTDGVFVIDPDSGQFLDINDTACRQLGYDCEELLELSVADIDSCLSDSDEWRQYVEEIKTNRRITFEGTYERKDGTTFPVEVKYAHVALNGDYVIAIAQDITDRRVRETELQQTKERFQKVFEHSNDAIFIIDPYEDEILDANPAGLELLKADREELLSRGPSDFHSSDEMDKFEEFVDNVFEEGHGRTDEITCVPKEGDPIPAEISASTIELNGRESMLAIVRDISERKKHERYQRELYEISADTDMPFDEKLDRLLELGRERFDLDQGYLTYHQPDNDTFEIKRAVGPDEQVLQEGVPPVQPEADRFCRRVIEQDEPIGVTNIQDRGWDTDPMHEEKGLMSYFGIKVTDVTDRYTTLCFADTSPRERPYTDAEDTFLELMGQLVSYELERHRREAQLAALNEMSRELMNAETLPEISDVSVEYADGSLQLPFSAIVTYDQETGQLTSAAQTKQAQDDLPSATLCDGTSGPVWEAFIEDETKVVDLTTDDTRTPPSDITHLIAVPLAQNGVFVTGTTTSDGFTASERDFIETTAATVEAAYERADRGQRLQEREETLEEQNENLERLNRINTIIREIDQTLVQASTRGEIEDAVCEQLADVGPYELAWIGNHDTVTDEITPSEWGGAENGYFDAVTISAGDEPTGHGPAGQAVKTREMQVVNDVLNDPSFKPWRQAALNRGYHSVISLPLEYEDTLYGVLVIYASQPSIFDELEQSVLQEMADTIAYAMNATESKKALVSDELAELEFAVDDLGTGLMDFVRTKSCEVALETLIPQSDGRLRGFFSTRGVSADEILDIAPQLPATDLTVVSENLQEDEPVCTFDVTLNDESLAETVLDHGGQLSQFHATEEEATITVHLAADAEVREFIEMFQTKYPDAELTAHRTHQQVNQTTQDVQSTVLDELTSRQLEVLQTAYFDGYFEEPRTKTASEIAATLDISQPTLASHIRAAQRKIFGQLFENQLLLT